MKAVWTFTGRERPEGCQVLEGIEMFVGETQQLRACGWESASREPQPRLHSWRCFCHHCGGTLPPGCEPKAAWRAAQRRTGQRQCVGCGSRVQGYRAPSLRAPGVCGVRAAQGWHRSVHRVAGLWSVASGSFSQVSCAGCTLHLWVWSLPAQKSPDRAPYPYDVNKLPCCQHYRQGLGYLLGRWCAQRAERKCSILKHVGDWAR